MLEEGIDDDEKPILDEDNLLNDDETLIEEEQFGASDFLSERLQGKRMSADLEERQSLISYTSDQLAVASTESNVSEILH